MLLIFHISFVFGDDKNNLFVDVIGLFKIIQNIALKPIFAKMLMSYWPFVGNEGLTTTQNLRKYQIDTNSPLWVHHPMKHIVLDIHFGKYIIL